jgi:hypothetical protein
MEKLIKCSFPWMLGNQLTLKFSPLVMDAFIALILDDYIVHDHTSKLISLWDPAMPKRVQNQE